MYVGGIFTHAGAYTTNCIARWDGSTWNPLGSGVNNSVRAIAVNGSDVYVGGGLTEAGGSPANHIARWDGSSWHPLGSGMGGVSYPKVNAIAANGSDVYAGGWFTQAGGSPANRIACWVGDSTGTESPMSDVIPGTNLNLRASPNPMETGTTISFESIGLSPLTLEIYDAAGHLVRTEDLGTLPTGSQARYWDGLDVAGVPWPRGCTS